jgi:hypothetical protein
VASDTNIGFIHAPGTYWWVSNEAELAVRVRERTLNPSPDGGVIHPQVSLLEKLLDLAIGKRVSEVPADSTENDFGNKVAAPLKDRVFGHDRRMVRPRETVLATHPYGVKAAIDKWVARMVLLIHR